MLNTWQKKCFYQIRFQLSLQQFTNYEFGNVANYRLLAAGWEFYKLSKFVFLDSSCRLALCGDWLMLLIIDYVLKNSLDTHPKGIMIVSFQYEAPFYSRVNYCATISTPMMTKRRRWLALRFVGKLFGFQLETRQCEIPFILRCDRYSCIELKITLLKQEMFN